MSRALALSRISSTTTASLLSSTVGRALFESSRVDENVSQQFNAVKYMSSDVPEKSPVASACACLERLPVLMPEMPQWEKEYRDWQEEFNSKTFKTLPSKLTEGAKSEGSEESSSTWEPAPRETLADTTGDRKSLRRRLDQRLFLLVKKNGQWGFLNSVIGDDDTSRSAAERALAEGTGGAYQHYFIGNTPAAHTSSGDDNDGEKRMLFYHRCQLIQGAPVLASPDVEDHAWVAPDEFSDYLAEEDAHVLKTMA
ncbi:hypothetical protein M9435_003095 [Picochlorum sp. BPE23]|jgi:large subunit ribosomal protein L46|nr:hypothetical protein M9435_003095 [Picochlorum sp. BPE23]